MPIELQACRFAYRRRHQPVFESLDVALPEGLSVLLGRNGAGKSTLLGLASSLLTPAKGTVRYLGLDPANRRDRCRFRRAVGWMPQDIAPVPRLTVREQVAYAAWLKGSSRTEAWDRAPRALARVGLAAYAQRRSNELSGGQRRRLGLAQLLAHDAKVLLMDEPTAGLDPMQCRRFADLIADASEGAHVVISTHQLDDLVEVYENVTVLDQGTIRFQGSTSAFLELAAPSSPDNHSRSDTRRAADALSGLLSEED